MKHYPYQVMPKPQNHIATVVSMGCMVAAIACFCFANTVGKYPALLQMLGVAALVVVVYMIARGQVRYIYSIEPDGTQADEDDFVVAQLKGKRRVVVCRLAMKDVRQMDIATAENKREVSELYREDTVHRYCPELLPARSVYLRFADSAPDTALSATEEEISSPAQRVVICISPDENLIAMFQRELENGEFR